MSSDRNPPVARRDLLRLAAGAAVAGAIAPWRATRAAGGLEVTDLRGGLRLIAGAGGNIVVLGTGEGQVVVDSGSEDSANAVAATLAELPGGAVHTLVNTHWHPAQTGGNVALGSAGAAILAHEKTRQRLTTGYYLRDEERYRAPLAAAGRPAQSFHTNGAMVVGGSTVEYGYLIQAHTDGDCYVRFADADVIAAGDVLSPARDPVFDWFGGGWLGGRVDSIALLLELGSESTIYVPSHGPAMSRAEVAAEHDLMLQFFELMVEHVRLGESAEDMFELGLLDQLDREFDDDFRLLYDTHKGFWAHHNKLMPDIV